jgi:hypothetical protein
MATLDQLASQDSELMARLMDPRVSNRTIASQLGCEEKVVRCWRRMRDIREGRTPYDVAHDRLRHRMLGQYAYETAYDGGTFEDFQQLVYARIEALKAAFDRAARETWDGVQGEAADQRAAEAEVAREVEAAAS